MAYVTTDLFSSCTAKVFSLRNNDAYGKGKTPQSKKTIGWKRETDHIAARAARISFLYSAKIRNENNQMMIVRIRKLAKKRHFFWKPGN